MPIPKRRTWPRWERPMMTLGVVLLLIAHITALKVGGYPKWPAWAVAANFAGLALFLLSLALSRATRR